MSDSTSSSSALNSLFANRTVMGGMMSGLDTENLVKAATMLTKTRINSQKQKLQTLTWKQDAYRGIITKLSDFQSKYLDILSPTSIRANAVMSKYKAESSNEKLQATASSNATPAEYEITYSKKATAASIQGGKASEGSIHLDFSNAVSGENKVEITLDGSTRTVTFNGGADVKQNFLDAVNKEFKDITTTRFTYRDDGSDDLTGTLVLKTLPNDKVSHNFEAKYNDALGLKNNAYSRISTQSTLGDVDFTTALQGKNFEFSINGVDFKFDADTKISDVINAVNKSDAGVTLSFSTLSQSFKIQTNKTGAGQQIEINQKRGNLINSLFNVSEGSEEGGISWGSSVSKAFTENVAVDGKNIIAPASAMSPSGYPSNRSMALEINDTVYKMDLSGLTQRQETVDINGYEAGVFKTADGKDRYTYKDDSGVTHFLDENKNEMFSTHNDAAGKLVVEKNGTVISDESEYADLLFDTGFDKAKEVAHSFTVDEYVNEFNSALRKAVGESEDVQEVAKLDALIGMGIHPADGETVDDKINSLDSTDKAAFDAKLKDSVEIITNQFLNGVEFKKLTETDDEGNEVIKVSLDTNGMDNTVAIKSSTNFGFGNTQNYNVHAKAPTADISEEKSLSFYNAEGMKVNITGTGTDGKITINDLTNYKDANGKAIFEYDVTDGTVTVTAGNSLTFADEATRAFMTDVFGKTNIKGTSDDSTLTVYGSNAQATINGITLESAESSFIVDGTTMTFDNVEDFDASVDPDSAITVKTTKDNSAIVETIKGFIDEYNTLITDLYKTINTARPKDGKSYYDPLTEEQEDEMSDDEIKDWNEKAKEGWLYNDASVSKVINSLRSAMSKTVDGMNLASMGINIKFITEGGSATDPKLYYDEADIEAAVEKWGDEVSKFFTDSENGLAVRLNKAIDDAISTKSTDGAGHKKAYGYLTSLAGVKDTVSEKKNQYYNQMQSIQKIIDNLQEKYKAEQERYWDQFTALETYISQMSSQMSMFQG